MRNPFLPKRPIRWLSGPAKGKVGIPVIAQESGFLSCTPPAPVGTYRKDPRGRKPKDRSQPSPPPKQPLPDTEGALVARSHHAAGKLNFCAGPFIFESNSGWGSNLDTLALAHGPVGCGGFTQVTRLNLPEFIQGIESFTALHACTDLTTADLEDGGDKKLARALNEAQLLFPLARGLTVLNEDPIALIDADVKGIAKAKTKETGRLIVPRACESIRAESIWMMQTATMLKAAKTHCRSPHSTAYDVVLPFQREASGLVWIVAKLLRDIGLNPIHELTGSSMSDMARSGGCRLVVGFAEKRDLPYGHFPGGAAQLLQRWFGMPLVWSCFVSPSATDASLQAIAAHFGRRVERRAEQVIAANRKKVEAIVALYRPRLEGKLMLHFFEMTEEQLEPYRLLGMRIGNASGWQGKTGKWRKPRLVCDPEKPSDKAIDSYIAEAKPDLILHFGNSEERGEYDWRKRGQVTLPFTPFFDRRRNAYWAYDGFACFAAGLDRVINAPWRKLLTPPWPVGGG